MDFVDSSGPPPPLLYSLRTADSKPTGAVLAAAQVPHIPQTPQPGAEVHQPQFGPSQPPQSPRASLNESINISGLSDLVKNLQSNPCTPERNQLADQLSILLLVTGS